MIYIFLKKYKELGWDVSRWQLKKKNYLNNINYDINKLMIINWMLGRLNKCGNKNWSFNILINVLLLLKNLRKEMPKDVLIILLNKLKQNVLLYNKKKGTLIYELPRFLTIEQSLKKIIEWLIKIAKKNKEFIIISIFKEIKNIFYNKGELFKKKKHIWDTIKKNKPFFYLLKKKK